MCRRRCLGRQRRRHLRRLIGRRQAGRMRRGPGIVWGYTDADHGDILMHRRWRPSVPGVWHVSRRRHCATILVLRRHAVVLRRSVRVVVRIYRRADVLLLLVVLRHILLLLPPPGTSGRTAVHIIDVGHASRSTVYILPSRQMVTVTHPAGLGCCVDPGIVH